VSNAENLLHHQAILDFFDPLDTASHTDCLLSLSCTIHKAAHWITPLNTSTSTCMPLI
jgi:hypothetical protein